MIRAIRFWLTLVGSVLYYATRVLWAALRRVPYQPGGIYDQVPVAWCRFMLRANGLTVGVQGAEHLAGLGPCVFVANHQSWVDVWAACTALPGPLRFVAKEELTRIPFFGPALRAAGHISIDRKDRTSAVAAYARAAEIVRQGVRAVIFAEGTRSRTGRLQPFKKGPFVLAILAQVPVVPVLIEGTFDILPKGAGCPRPGPITVHIGPPIATTGLRYEDRDALIARCRAAMVAMGAKDEPG